MYKILISGYYGFNNIGDESILRAVVNSLREGLLGIEITVLSHDPKGTAEKFEVLSQDRKKLSSIIKSVAHCDLLISGGGSLLQDVTSKKSILYYLFIMWLAHFMGKDFFIYSQGIGPINSNFNRRLTRKVLRHASGIVVRDEASREFLAEIGIDPARVVVTADPVLKIHPAKLDTGREILSQEGCRFLNQLRTDNGGSDLKEGGNMEQNPHQRNVVGLAIKERKLDSTFASEVTEAAARLITEKGCKLVLIPFHYNQDMEIVEHIEKELEARGLGDSVCAVKHKYLTNEMMSIIGNTDILVGVRLHSLIHAAIMGIPMMGISYDPKINSFLHSVGQRAVCSVYDFTADYFLEEFDKTLNNADNQVKLVGERVKILRSKLDNNEELIRNIMNKSN